MLEGVIQRGIVQYLNTVLTKTHRIFAIPNASRRTHGGHAGNAVPGLRKGVPDLMIVGQGRAYFIEVKTPSGKLSPEQSEWADWCVVSGGAGWCCARSIDDVRRALSHWGIPTNEAK